MVLASAPPSRFVVVLGPRDSGAGDTFPRAPVRASPHIFIYRILLLLLLASSAKQVFVLERQDLGTGNPFARASVTTRTYPWSMLVVQ